MPQDVIDSFNELLSAFGRFKKNVLKAKEDYEKELVVKRFDYIIGRFIKNLKLLLETRGYNCILPEDCIKAAARFGFLASHTIFIEMLDDRYKLSYLKNQNHTIPDDIYQKIKIRYTIALGKSLERIKRDYIDT